MQQGGHPSEDVLVVAQDLRHGLYAGEGADQDVGCLGDVDVGEEFPLRLGLFEEFPDDGSPVREGSLTVDLLRFPVQ
ncbi:MULTISPECIES: hypothetical protein [Streptomyces]|uniref:Uncharacterized protein n=1 Tax=Streptomyces wadayamensis TaxID=141454 RepID=A0ABR4SFU8_9ACTN|nr:MULTISPECIES: hypothetical protein [Streptomyces]KDR64075.1 hypothetical protein DC60_31245 [Streptomyces wadayamensis]QXQ34620.1 hypothetical protein STALF4_30520 [Streptomyces albidoflavus]